MLPSTLPNDIHPNLNSEEFEARYSGRDLPSSLARSLPRSLYFDCAVAWLVPTGFDSLYLILERQHSALCLFLACLHRRLPRTHKLWWKIEVCFARCIPSALPFQRNWLDRFLSDVIRCISNLERQHNRLCQFVACLHRRVAFNIAQSCPSRL